MAKPLNPNDPAIQELFAQVVAANDRTNRLWFPSEVQAAQQYCQRILKQVPDFDWFVQLLGIDEAERAVQRAQDDRRGMLDIFSIDVPEDRCHTCKRRAPVKAYKFGLAKILEQPKRDWSTTAASAAIAAITIPLLGGGYLFGSGKSQRGRVLRMELLLCAACQRERRTGLFRVVNPSSADYVKHPRWTKAQEHGFTDFLHGSLL